MKLANLVVPALLLASVPMAAPSALAETGIQPLTVSFAYDPAAPAAEIYADLTRTAKRACEADRPGPISLKHLRTACAQRLLDAAVQRINRAEIASLHALTQG